MALSKLKLKIMVKAFKIRLEDGETFEEIAKDYPKLSEEDLELIKEELEL